MTQPPAAAATLQLAVNAQQLWFTGTREVEVRAQALPPPGPGHLLVATQYSALSAGTELLVYRGQVPDDMALDASLQSLQHKPVYPMQYGYATVGTVQQTGNDVDTTWLGKRVFAFQPHASHFLTTPQQVIAVPDDIDMEAAVFLANMETAVNLVQDGHPGIGESVVVLGQGIVGLLLAGLLAQFPLQRLSAFDALPARRAQALQAGAQVALDPGSTADIGTLTCQPVAAARHSGADLIYEVSGAPDALNLAIALSGYASRIVIGSWYGSKTAAIALGGDAHRNRLAITTSQVSTIAPTLSGRWDKPRRFALAWQQLRRLQPQQLITHRVTLAEAAALYAQLDRNPGDVLQAIFTYPADS